MTGVAERAAADRIFAAFRAAGAEPVETDILQPADLLLDLYGEDMRARAFVTQDPTRGELMLRPDFTVPVARMHIAATAGTTSPGEARYAYCGTVFRKQDDPAQRASEFTQVGYEFFDHPAAPAADAEVFALFHRILSPLGLRAATGDIGILLAAVRGLGTTAPRRDALLRHIWRPRRFRSLLDRFSGRVAMPAARARLLATLAAGDPAAMATAAGPHIGLRGTDEIAARAAALLTDAAAPPIPATEVTILDDILGLRQKAPDALARLHDIAVDMPTIAPAVARLETRLAALRDHGIAVAELDFEAAYGRTTLEYYDGFVFGFYAESRPDLRAIASGGRYDALTAVLGRATARAVPAVGGVIRPGLVAALGGFAA